MAKHAIWSGAVRADVRRLDRSIAMHLLEGLHRYLITGEGDVKQLQGRDGELRLRLGNYRICFTPEGEILHIHWVRHRHDAYRQGSRP